MKVQTIITAAGDSRNAFVAGGFGCPKSLVLVDGKTVLQRAIEAYTVDFSDLKIAVNEDEASEWAVEKHIVEHFPNSEIIRVSSAAKGALASALLASSNLNMREPLVIAAGDSQVGIPILPHVEKFWASGLPASTLVFASTGSRWSYLSVDAHGKVVEVSEKYEVSSLATTGFFFFRTAQSFVESARWVLLNNATVNGRYYISTTLNFIISSGLEIGYDVIPSNEYKSWSLPMDFAKRG